MSFETLMPILANILAPAVLDYLFGDNSKGSGVIANLGYPMLERNLEYLVPKNFSDIKTKPRKPRSKKAKIQNAETQKIEAQKGSGIKELL
jgi:hypothetical protein